MKFITFNARFTGDNVTCDVHLPCVENLVGLLRKVLAAEDEARQARVYLRGVTYGCGKIDAIKELRTLANLGLKDAKDAVEGCLNTGLDILIPNVDQEIVYRSKNLRFVVR